MFSARILMDIFLTLGTFIVIILGAVIILYYIAFGVLVILKKTNRSRIANEQFKALLKKEYGHEQQTQVS
jgi:hypothetical protein